MTAVNEQLSPVNLMTQDSPWNEAVKENRPADGSMKITLPSWLISVAVHVLILFVFAVSLQSWDKGYDGSSDEDVREVGIFVKPAETVTENNPETDEAETTENTEDENQSQVPPTEAELADATQDALKDVNVELQLPNVDQSGVLAPGAPLSLPVNAAKSDIVAALAGAPRPGAALAAAQGTTAFFDIKAKGTRFVYLVDNSGSMFKYHALAAAKSELITSLQSLDSTQQFQVIFYNNDYQELKLRDKKPSLVWGTDINKTLARQFIRRIGSEGGTKHMPALRKALSYRPEHLFFLTDADEPILTAGNLSELKRINRSRTQIHCVQFGKVGDLGNDNFLKKLARQNGGTYRYRDVRNFAP